MILSGKEIIRQMKKGNIQIDPFDERLINPNSCNLRLSPELVCYKDSQLDMKKQHEVEHIIIPDDGYVIQPGKLYLGRTVEYTITEKFVPMLEGRSSMGRLGIFIHVTAGFGDVGLKGYWTLEINCIQPVKIYPHVAVCQIFYHTIEGDYTNYAQGKYQNNLGIQPSMLYKDF